MSSLHSWYRLARIGVRAAALCVTCCTGVGAQESSGSAAGSNAKGAPWIAEAPLLEPVVAIGTRLQPTGFKLLVTGTNLTNKSPPWSTHFRGYDIYNYDIIGRTIFVRLQAQL